MKALHESVVSDAWPMLRHDPACTGSDGSSPQAPLEEAWNFQAAGDIESPLAAAYAMVFFGCRDKCLYAVDAASGQKKYTFKTDGEIIACPVVADGLVYVAGRDKSMYAIEARSGEKRWQFFAKGEISTPAVADGTVFFGCKDKSVYALDASTGQKKWEFRTGFANHSAPTLSEGKVLISGKGLLNKKLLALNVADGSLLWELEGYSSDPCPVVFGSPPKVLALDRKGYCAVINATDGKDQPASPTVPFVGKIGTSGNFLFGLVRDGNLLCYEWRNQTTYSYIGDFWSAYIVGMREDGYPYSISEPAVGGDFVFVSTIGNKIVCGINIRELMKRWEYRLPHGEVISPPIVANGMVFVASSGRRIHAFRSATDTRSTIDLEYGSKVATGKGDDSFDVYVTESTPFHLPLCCSVCCGPAQKFDNQIWSYAPPGPGRRGIIKSINVPYCASCYEKKKSAKTWIAERGFGYARWDGEPESVPGVFLLQSSPPGAIKFSFRNEQYCAMFLRANRIR